MKHKLWWAFGALIVSSGLVFAVGAFQRAVELKTDPASILPDGAMLAVEAKDFSALLQAWTSSDEKRLWMAGNNYQAFSRSRLFTRLQDAQNEFAEVATLTPDGSLLQAAAGGQSGLAIYDIGKLEFVYVTRMDTNRIQALPLWMARGKFERRSEAGSDFYLRKDEKNGRQAAFAARDGWLILGTREDLVAGVLDRIAAKVDHNLANEEWYAEAVKQAGNRGELRMVLDLTSIVPSPYFRSYWVQRNITEMKQYAAAVVDLERDGSVYREQRVLLRGDAGKDAAAVDAAPIFQLAPEQSPLAIAESAADRGALLRKLREDLLEVRPEQQGAADTLAPTAAQATNSGSASQLDVMIDQAPAVTARADVYQPLRAQLQVADPLRVLRCYSTSKDKGGVFVTIHTAMVLEARNGWNSDAMRQALTEALAPATTVSKLGAGWQQRTGHSGEYLALDGPVSLFLKIDANRMYLSTDAELLESVLAQAHKASGLKGGESQSYVAVYRHSLTTSDYMHLMQQLDRSAGHVAAGAEADSTSTGEPAFFSGNIGSLTKTFARLDSEEVQERDLGSKVLQTVTYRWK